MGVLRFWILLLLILTPTFLSAAPFVYEAPLVGFDVGGYQAAVDALLRAYEAGSGKTLVPGEKGSAGIKVYTASGPGLSTPLPLVRAVIAALEARGFERSQLILVDLEERYLREAEFLPKLSEGGWYFEGVPVYALDTGLYWDPQWFYESALPPRMRKHREPGGSPEVDDRKSLLPVPLLLDVDFWINLPVIANNDAFGVSAALANASVWSVSNNLRFLGSLYSGPMAVAEIAAIPELQATWALNIVSLEYYQFVGGPEYNALYTHSEPLLWLSSEAPALDAAALSRINKARAALKFYTVSENLPLFQYCKSLGVGGTQGTQWVRVNG